MARRYEDFSTASNGWDGTDGMKLLLTSWATALLV
jgi:hypothetical protein